MYTNRIKVWTPQSYELIFNLRQQTLYKKTLKKSNVSYLGVNYELPFESIARNGAKNKNNS